MPWFVYNLSGIGPRQLYAPNRQRADAAIRDIYPNVSASYAGQSGGEEQLSGIAVLGDAGQDGVTPGPDAENQVEFQRAAYMQGLKNAGYSSTGALSGYLKNRFAPAAANFWANTQLAEGRGETPSPDFQAYSQANAGGGSNLYQAALDKFRQIAGGASIGAPGVLDDPTNQAIRNVVAGPGGNYNDSAASGIRGNVLELARAGARGQYSPWSTTILPSDARLREKFEEDLYANTGSATGSTQGLNWAEFLKRSLGLR